MKEKKEKAVLATTNSPNTDGKDNENFRGKQKVFMCLFEEPRTRSQVSVLTGIWINSVCYYVGMLAEEGKVKVHHKGKCPIKRSDNVEFLTTNPKLFPKENQLSLFDILWKVFKK